MDRMYNENTLKSVVKETASPDYVKGIVGSLYLHTLALTYPTLKLNIALFWVDNKAPTAYKTGDSFDYDKFWALNYRSADDKTSFAFSGTACHESDPAFISSVTLDVSNKQNTLLVTTFNAVAPGSGRSHWVTWGEWVQKIYTGRQLFKEINQ